MSEIDALFTRRPLSQKQKTFAETAIDRLSQINRAIDDLVADLQDEQIAVGPTNIDVIHQASVAATSIRTIQGRIIQRYMGGIAA